MTYFVNNMKKGMACIPFESLLKFCKNNKILLFLVGLLFEEISYLLQ